MQRNLVWEFLFGIFRNTLFQSSCGSFLNVVIHFCYIQLEEGNPKKTPRALAKLGRAGTCFGKPWGLYPSPSLKFMGFVLMKTLHSGTFKPCGILAWELFLWCLFGNLENLAFFSNLGIKFSAAPRQLVSSHYDRRPQAIALLNVLAKPTRVHPTLKNMNHAGSETTRDACSLIDGKKPSSVHHENHAWVAKHCKQLYTFGVTGIRLSRWSFWWNVFVFFLWALISHMIYLPFGMPKKKHRKPSWIQATGQCAGEDKRS